tara:strand:+ start:1704 stop:1991 length:288 start_codon:yes stop_codon:yes gene_type:complete
MKVSEIMERAGIKSTGRAVAYIRDALEEINLLSETHVRTLRQQITKDQRFYDIPLDVVKILKISCKSHLNTKEEYRKIPRMIGEPYTLDADEELL